MTLLAAVSITLPLDGLLMFLASLIWMSHWFFCMFVSERIHRGADLRPVIGFMLYMMAWVAFITHRLTLWLS